MEGVSDPYQGNQRKTEDGQDVEGRRNRNRAAELRRGKEEGPLTSAAAATRLFPSGRMNLIKIDEIGSLSPSSAGREERGQSLRTELLPFLSVKGRGQDFVHDLEFVNSCTVAMQPGLSQSLKQENRE